MAERLSRSKESEPEELDLDLASGIGVVINIGHKCSHLTTSTSATGSHTRNFLLMDGGSNNHVGNDSHDDSVAISGTSKDTHLLFCTCLRNLANTDVFFFQFMGQT